MRLRGDLVDPPGVEPGSDQVRERVHVRGGGGRERERERERESECVRG